MSIFRKTRSPLFVMSIRLDSPGSQPDDQQQHRPEWGKLKGIISVRFTWSVEPPPPAAAALLRQLYFPFRRFIPINSQDDFTRPEEDRGCVLNIYTTRSCVSGGGRRRRRGILSREMNRGKAAAVPTIYHKATGLAYLLPTTFRLFFFLLLLLLLPGGTSG